MSKKVLDLPGAGLLRFTFIVGCLAVLASCGGGGGGSSPAAPPVAVNPPTPEPTGPDFSDLDNFKPSSTAILSSTVLATS
ncbi:hypothetical protein N9L59_06195 [Luminiphilus sp.]|nr:hypothetical protein [Luminiphilus sp.]